MSSKKLRSARVFESDLIYFDEFHSVVRQRSEGEIANWLLDGFEDTSNFHPIRFKDEPNIIEQLNHFFNSLPRSLREKFRKAVFQALRLWNPSNDNIKMLKDISWLIAYLRIEDTIDDLRELAVSTIWEEFYLRKNEAEDDINDIQKTLVGVIAGFSPSQKARNVMEDLFFDSYCNPKLAPQLFIGLCECAPEKYIIYTPRFFKLIAAAQSHFTLDFISHEFVHCVTLPRIAMTVSEMGQPYQGKLLRLLCRTTSSPARIIQIDNGRLALAERYPDPEHLSVSADPSMGIHKKLYN